MRLMCRPFSGIAAFATLAVFVGCKLSTPQTSSSVQGIVSTQDCTIDPTVKALVPEIHAELAQLEQPNRAMQLASADDGKSSDVNSIRADLNSLQIAEKEQIKAKIIDLRKQARIKKQNGDFAGARAQLNQALALAQQLASSEECSRTEGAKTSIGQQPSTGNGWPKQIQPDGTVLYGGDIRGIPEDQFNKMVNDATDAGRACYKKTAFFSTDSYMDQCNKCCGALYGWHPVVFNRDNGWWPSNDCHDGCYREHLGYWPHSVAY